MSAKLLSKEGRAARNAGSAISIIKKTFDLKRIGDIMAAKRNVQTFEKRRKEDKRKRKQEEKRERRFEKNKKQEVNVESPATDSFSPAMPAEKDL
jgi:superfamily II DNA/RNA helicase